ISSGPDGCSTNSTGSGTASPNRPWARRARGSPGIATAWSGCGWCSLSGCGCGSRASGCAGTDCRSRTGPIPGRCTGWWRAAVRALDELRAAQAPLGQLLTKLTSWSNAPQATVTVHELRAAVERGDVPAYGAARARLAELVDLRARRARREEFTARMAAAPAL